MRVPSLFKEYIWLVNTIWKARRISFADLQDKWLDTDMSEGIELARSTFNRHKDAIEDIFGIYIDCDRKNGYKYYIGNEDVLRENSIQNWMLSTLSVSNIISESLSVQDRILLESVPSERNCLTSIIEAMKNNLKVSISYKKYGTNESHEMTFEPYCVKLFKRRWYVLGHFHSDARDGKPERDYFSTFSFDRIKSLRLTDEKFIIDKDFNADEWFSEYYGVLTDESYKVERIILRAYGMEQFYMRDLPIHVSQQEISQCEDYADFELKMRPTVDFNSYVLSRSNQLKVLEPEWLASEIKEMLQETMDLYKND